MTKNREETLLCHSFQISPAAYQATNEEWGEYTFGDGGTPVK